MKGHHLQYCVLWWESLPCWMGNPGHVSPCVAVISYIIIPVSWLIMDFVQSPWVMWEELSFSLAVVFVSSPEHAQEKTALMLTGTGESHWRALSSLLLIKTWPLFFFFFLFSSLISSSAILKILRDDTGEMNVCPDAFSRMVKSRERERNRGREKEDKSTSALTNSSHKLHTEELH